MMAITSVSGISSAAANPAQQAQQAQLRAAASLTLANANSATVALQSIVDNATRTALIGRSPSFVANIEGLGGQTAPTLRAPPPAEPANAPDQANAENAATVTIAAAPAPANAAPAIPASTAASVPTLTPSDEAAAAVEISSEAQANLVERRIAHDISAAFNVVMTDQTYSSAATALYLSAAAYRLQIERPKEPDLATPGPVQPVKPLTAVESATSSGVGRR